MNMDELDITLIRLARAPVAAGLDGMEAKVFARIGARPRVDAGIGLGAMTTAAALVMGVVAGVSAHKDYTAVSLSPLGGAAPLAPSTLLAGAP